MLDSSENFEEFERQEAKVVERNSSDALKKAYAKMKEQLGAIRDEIGEILKKDSKVRPEIYSIYVENHLYELFSEVIQKILTDERNRRKISLAGSKGGRSNE